jgi:uncharacterized membrane protein YtjA (UPF0391 family)
VQQQAARPGQQASVFSSGLGRAGTISSGSADAQTTPAIGAWFPPGALKNRRSLGNRSGQGALPFQTRRSAPAFGNASQGDQTMLGWALTFLVIALIAAAFGFGGIAGTSAGIAQILFFIFIALFVISMIARAIRGKPPV